MADEKEKQSEGDARHGGGVLRWVWIAGLILVLYVLSVGPAKRLMYGGILSESVYSVLYLPIALLCVHCEPANKFFTWYLSFWVKFPIT